MYTPSQALLTYGLYGMSVKNLDINEIIPLPYNHNQIKESVCSYRHYQPNNINSIVKYEDYRDE